LNKSELVASVADKSGLSRKDAEAAVTATIDEVRAALARGERVALVGFGTFEVRERSARSGRNPQTGAAIEIPASRMAAFKAGKALKEALRSAV